MDARKLMFILIGFVCLISVIFIVYSEIYTIRPSQELVQNTSSQNVSDDKLSTTEIINNFSSIFQNTINYQGVTITNSNKIENNKELVYTSYELNEQIPNKYNINVKIPAININTPNIININNEINAKFKNKVTNIIANSESTDFQMYDVEYMAYVNSNVLSLVIKATLKNGNSAQRVLVKTYNYSLSSGTEINFENALSLKGVSKIYATNKINETIKKANEDSQTLKNLGYNVYTRDLNSDIYKLENTIIFFFGENAKFYIIYPYGNTQETSEMDVIVF